MPEEAKQLTQNDIVEITELFKGILKTTSTLPVETNLGYRASELMELVEQMSDKVPSVGNVVVQPFISTLVRNCLNPLIERGRKVGDKYIEKIETVINRGHYKKLPDLLQLSTLNQMRLQYSTTPMFSGIREYIIKKYHTDVSDTNGSVGFIPARSEKTLTLWSIIDALSAKGLLTVLEDSIIISKQDTSVEVAIIRMAENV